MPVVDLRFVVHDREDIELATKSLVEFNKVSYKRQKNYDAEAAAAKRGMTATNKLLSLDRKLTTQRKIEEQMVEDGLMSKKEQIALSERYDRILEQETRTLQGYIDTDRVLQKQQRDSAKAEEALNKQRTKTKNETEKLRRTYDSTYAATKRYKQGLKDIDRAFEGMEDGPERASRAIKALKSDYQAFIAASKSGGIVDAGNQFARYGDQAYRAQQRTKRFASVGLQQAGYQVNDFIVQIASGQNALVAFGQQGSQLAGIFGTKGAVVGALIAGVAALGNLAYQAYMAREGIKTLEDALSDLGDALSMVSEAEQTLEDLASGEYLGHMTEEVDNLADSLRALGLAKGLSEVVSGMKAVTDTDMGFMDEFIKGSIEKSKDLIPFYRMFATDFYRETQTLTQKMQDDQAKNMAASLFGEDSTKVGYTEAFLQDLLKLQEAKASAEEVAKRISRFTKQAELWGFKDATTDGEELFAEIIKLGQGAAKIAEAQADSVRLEKVRRAAVLESAKEFEALYKLMDKEDKEYWKGYYKNYKLQQKQQADRLKAGIAAAKKIVDAQEKAAEGGAKVQLKYQNAVMAARAKLANAEGKNADAQRQEKALAAKVAEEQVRAQYESLRLKNGQLQLTAKQTAEMDKQVRLARAAATQAVVLKYEAKTAAERIAEGAKAARELATQIERASKAYETFLNKTNNINDNTAGIRKQIEILRKGGSTADASAEGKNETAMRKVQREADELRAQQEALGADRTLTDTEITASQLAQERALAQNLAAIRLKNRELDKRKKAPKEKKDPLVELQNRLNLQTDLLGMTEAQGQVYEALGDKYSEVDREVIRSLESQIEYNKMVEFGTNQLADGLMSIVDGTKSVKDAFKDMARELVAQLYKVYVMERMVASIGGYLGGMESVGSASANGNVFNSGSLVPYANGGIVAGPTTFPMSGGKTGLMGEAGPEAIMPLKRGANGKLGVQAEGGSGDVIIHQNFNFTANGDESVKKIIAQQAPAIANMTKKQILDDRRRGGQMKQAFG